jgi:hypothetical protein
MKIITRFYLFTVIIGLNAAMCYGTTFEYQYVFPDYADDLGMTNNPLTISGTLDGTQNGNFINNVTNVTMYFNGIQVTGPIYAANFVRYGGHWGSTPYVIFYNNPVISFDVLLNDFIFANSDVLNGNTSYNTYFYAKIAENDSAGSIPGSALGRYWAYGNAGSWSLQAVPETASTLGLVSMALIFLGIGRRRFIG